MWSLPPEMNRSGARSSAGEQLVRGDSRRVPGVRDHFTCGEPGREAVADFALDWALAPVPGELGCPAPLDSKTLHVAGFNSGATVVNPVNVRDGGTAGTSIQTRRGRQARTRAILGPS